MTQAAPLDSAELDMMIGSLVRACADYDQWLFRMVTHLRLGQRVRDDFRLWADGDGADWREHQAAEPPGAAPIEDGYERTRQKLVRVLAKDLTGTEHLQETLALFEASKGPHEIRNIVAHWDLLVWSRDNIVASSFIATEGLDHPATRLMEKYRTPPRRPELRDTEFHDRTVTLNFEQIREARDMMREITHGLRTLTATMAVAYVNEPNFPKPLA